MVLLTKKNTSISQSLVIFEYLSQYALYDCGQRYPEQRQSYSV